MMVTLEECHDVWVDCGRKVNWVVADNIMENYLPDGSQRFIRCIPEEKREEFITELKKAIQEKKDEASLKKR